MRETPPERVEGRDSELVISEAVRSYAELLPQLQEATRVFVELIRSLLDEAGINYLTVTGRTKTVESFAGKARRTKDGRLLFDHPLEQITDPIGVRVITYVRDDVAAVADLLAGEFVVLDDRDLGLETARAGRYGYASRHILVALDASRSIPTKLGALRRRSASVQIRTVLQHAWAEFEHDIRYKGSVPEEHASDLDRRFTLAAGLLDLADHEFSEIRNRLQAGSTEHPETASARAADADSPDRPEPEQDGRIGAHELATFLAGHYSDAGWSRTDHYAWISGLLRELGITSLEALSARLSEVSSTPVTERMGYKYPPGAVRRLDDDLLALYGVAYLELAGNSHRTDQLRARLDRLTA